MAKPRTLKAMGAEAKEEGEEVVEVAAAAAADVVVAAGEEDLRPECGRAISRYFVQLFKIARSRSFSLVWSF
jgi:hypothetical protein